MNPNTICLITKYRREETENYFSKSENSQEKVMYQFFKKEMKSHDIRIAHTDVSIIGNTRKKRKYVCALWRKNPCHP